MSHRLSWLAAVWFLCALQLAALPLCVELEVTKSTTSRDGKAQSLPPERVKVVLAQDYLEYEGADGRTVHDFTQLQSHLVRGDDYVRRSLYADVGFRAAELRNRWVIIAAMREAGIDDMPDDEVDVEHLFSLDDEVTEANLTRTDNERIAFTKNGKLLAEFSRQGRALSEQESKAFVRFLRYYVGGHPDILADLQVRRVLPESLRIDLRNVGELTSYVLVLKSVQPCQPVRPDFSAMRPTELPPEPLGTLVALAMQLDLAAVAKGRETLLTRAEQALAEGRGLESVLMLFEHLLMAGDGTPELLSAERDAYEADAGSKSLFEALLVGRDDPKTSAEMFSDLLAPAGNHAHIVKIFRAGMLSGGEHMVEARNLFLEALMVNPAIVGAWKDLGDIYYANYEIDTAWLCWDVGRRLAPQHSMMVEVTRLEQALRSSYPGFF